MRKISTSLICFFVGSIICISQEIGSTGKYPEPIKPAKENFDTIVEGKQISLYVLKNKNGTEVYLTNYGARIVSIFTPDRNGKKADIALGFSSIDEYLNDKFTGCVVGRFANRIAAQPVKIEGKEYLFSTESPMLHGGKNGFNKKIWTASQKDNIITMNYTSPDMQEGFPGTLNTIIKYSLTDKDELTIEYEATTDKPTIVNLSNHSYFNLKGDGDSSILGHNMQINAESITPVDASLIPTGKLMPVLNTPFDFRNGMLIGKMINEYNEQLKFGKGYDHNWVLNKNNNELSFAVKLSEPSSGRVMTIYTTKPGMQFYSGNFMNGKQIGKHHKPFLYRSGMALEPQHFPDSPHFSNFPSTVLKQGEIYRHKDVYKFSVE